MSQELLNAKLNRGFDHLDADHDGTLTEADHVAMGRSVAASLGHAAGSAEEAKIIEGYLTIWRDLHAPDGAEAITREQFLASTGSLADKPAEARATLGALGEAFLEIASEGTGRVTVDEFFAFQRGHFPALTREEAEEAFRHLDRNGDGVLERDEFVNAIIEYWTSTDPAAPGNWWTGNPELGSHSAA